MFVPNVEYILVDPSCSGSGMTNRLFVSSEKDTDRLANLTGLQSRMLSHAMRAFTKAKKIVYSTCSIHFEENEKVVQECLEMCPDWKLIKPIEFAEKWKHFGSPKFKHIGKKCIYAKEIDLTDGFFVAMFEREIDPTKPIEPYSRNEAVLERISWNFKPKFSTNTTADIESKPPTAVETVDLTENEVVETPPESVPKNKKKRKEKDKDSISDDTLIKSVETHTELASATEIQKPKKRKKSCSDVEAITLVDENIDEKTNGEKSKKKKRKVLNESDVSPISNLDDLVSCDIKKEKKKKNKHDENTCLTKAEKHDATEDATVKNVDTAVEDSDAINVKPKKKKSKNK